MARHRSLAAWSLPDVVVAAVTQEARALLTHVALKRLTRRRHLGQAPAKSFAEWLYDARVDGVRDLLGHCRVVRHLVESLEDVGVGLFAGSALADGGGALLDAGHPPSVACFLKVEGEVLGGVVLVVYGGTHDYAPQR